MQEGAEMSSQLTMRPKTQKALEISEALFTQDTSKIFILYLVIQLPNEAHTTENLIFST